MINTPEIKQAKAKAGGGDVNPELTVLVEEADNWKDKYDDLLENVARLEGRMGKHQLFRGELLHLHHQTFFCQGGF